MFKLITVASMTVGDRRFDAPRMNSRCPFYFADRSYADTDNENINLESDQIRLRRLA